MTDEDCVYTKLMSNIMCMIRSIIIFFNTVFIIEKVILCKLCMQCGHILRC